MISKRLNIVIALLIPLPGLAVAPAIYRPAGQAFQMEGMVGHGGASAAHTRALGDWMKEDGDIGAVVSQWMIELPDVVIKGSPVRSGDGAEDRSNNRPDNASERPRLQADHLFQWASIGGGWGGSPSGSSRHHALGGSSLGATGGGAGSLASNKDTPTSGQSKNDSPAASEGLITPEEVDEELSHSPDEVFVDPPKTEPQDQDQVAPPVPVPEPGTLGLLGSSLLAMAFSLRRRRSPAFN